MYRITLRNWIKGRIGPREVDILVRGGLLTAEEAATVKATERQVPWVEISENTESK